jgi:AbrB family looped-hinge helix DNA binding protein
MARRRGHILTVQERGLLAIPADLRRRAGLTPGSQVEIVELDDGRFELVPLVTIPASQTWFWTERWQKLEREVDEHIAQGEVTTFDDSDSFLEHLDKLTSD